MIGLERGTVRLVPHDPNWAELFENERQLIQNTFGECVKAIEHVGSTTIPSIPAKPIIDMNIGVDSLEVALAMKDKFRMIGYEHRPFVPGHTKEDLAWQELYVKGPESNRTHHAHVTVYGNDYWNNDILFRDYLLRNPARSRQYAELKTALAQKYGDDRKAYTEGKKKFIEETVSLAAKNEGAQSNKFPPFPDCFKPPH